MAAALTVLSSLEILFLIFSSSRLPPHRKPQSLPPQNQFVLSALRTFYFDGVTEYLEDLASTFVDAPQRRFLYITFLNQINFDCSRLAQFIDCLPTLRVLDKAHVQFEDFTATIRLEYRTSDSLYLTIDINCREPNWQLSSLSRVCNSPLPPLSTVEDLCITHHYREQVWKNDANEHALWLQLLLPYTSVKNLYLSEKIASVIAKELGSFRENIGQFITARQLSGHPVVISVRNEV